MTLCWKLLHSACWNYHATQLRLIDFKSKKTRAKRQSNSGIKQKKKISVCNCPVVPFLKHDWWQESLGIESSVADLYRNSSADRTEVTKEQYCKNNTAINSISSCHSLIEKSRKFPFKTLKPKLLLFLTFQKNKTKKKQNMVSARCTCT